VAKRERDRAVRTRAGRRSGDADPLIRQSSLYALFMQAPAVICVLRGPDHVFELVNPGYQQLFHGRQLLGRPIREALPEIEQQGFVEILNRVYASGQEFVAREARVMLDRAGDGHFEEAFFNFVYQPMNSEGQTVEGIIVFAFEVTAEVRARQESEEVFRLLVESVQDYAILMLDPEGRVSSWNSGARRITGYERDEIIGGHVSIFYPPEDIAAGKPEALLAQARQTGRVEDEGWRVRKDGTRFRADVITTPVHDANGRIRGFAKVMRDVTRRRRAEETERALTVAQEVNHAKDEFLAVISHELRTPLTSILGWARMLRIGELDEATTLEALNALERSAQAQVRLIEDLLDDTRITAGKLRLHKRPLEMKDVIASALADLGPAAAEKDVRLVSDIDCGHCPIDGDPIRLQQVVWNLVSNAIKFTPEGGSVFVSLTRSRLNARLEIRDTGRGIDPALLPQLFQRFRQGDSASDRKAGVGLGLAISKYLIEQHGGRIEASSEGKGKGSTFTLELPLTIEESGKFTQREPERAADLPDLSGLRILIVEDEADNRDVFAAVIEHCGGEAQCSDDAEDGLRRIESWHPDVIVCDIALPGIDGCDFITMVRQHSDTPALALTVFGSGDEEARIRNCGFDVFRQKPIEPADFAHEVARLSRRAGDRDLPVHA
jgi:PAS domain S-box-containing protein